MWSELRWGDVRKVMCSSQVLAFSTSLFVCVRVCIHVCVWSRWLSLSLRTESWCWSYMHTCMHEHTHVNTQSRPDGERVFGGGGGFPDRLPGVMLQYLIRASEMLELFHFLLFQKKKKFYLEKDPRFVTTVSLDTQHKSNTWSRLLFQSSQELSGQIVIKCL